VLEARASLSSPWERAGGPWLLLELETTPQLTLSLRVCAREPRGGQHVAQSEPMDWALRGPLPTQELRPPRSHSAAPLPLSSLLASCFLLQRHQSIAASAPPRRRRNWRCRRIGFVWADHTNSFPAASAAPPVPSRARGRRSSLGALARRAGAAAAPPRKQVLFSICGSCAPGRLLGLMGPSGSGKSSLLSVLAGRSPASVSGSVSFNGAPATKAVKRRTGFVTQARAPRRGPALPLAALPLAPPSSSAPLLLLTTPTPQTSPPNPHSSAGRPAVC